MPKKICGYSKGMSGTDHSFGCKCGNCKGLIEAGNLVPLFIPNHEEIKMRKFGRMKIKM